MMTYANLMKVNDLLFAQSICPADLLQFPCRWDELGGCNMLRICKASPNISQLIVYNNRR
jgi:hypothetical protein